MRYLKETGQLTPEWQMKLEHAINLGYQRLLTFETSGGGFDWYGRPPAKTILTAYGILELNDMDRVYPIDRDILERARAILRNRQRDDGSWSLDRPMYTWEQLGNASLPLTAYVTWALLEGGFEEPAGVSYLEKHLNEARDPYALALAANALLLADSSRAPEAIDRLSKLATLKRGAATWKTEAQGVTYATGEVASIETTALATLALIRARSPLANKGLTALVQAKDEAGGWHSTQSTILAIKALVEAMSGEKPPEKPVRVSLRINGQEVPQAFEPITPENNDVVQQVNVSEYLREGANEFELVADSELRLSWQVSGRYYLPWHLVPEQPEAPLSITTRYDRTKLTREDRLTCTVELTYRGDDTFMVIADLGIPPGFNVDTSSFEKLLREGVIDKYTLTGRQLTLYFGQVSRGYSRTFTYSLRPRFPIKAKAPRSQAYEYYTPQNESSSEPVLIEVED